MADGDQDKEQKTEQPSQRRLEEAHKRGQIAFSREVLNFFIILTLTGTVALYSPYMMRQTKLLLMPFIVSPEQIVMGRNELGHTLTTTILHAGLLLSMPLLLTMFAAFAAGFIQNGFVLSADPIMPKLSKISPLAGFKRLFSMRSIVELIKGIIKITIVGAVSYYAVSSDLVHIKQLPDEEMIAILLFLLKVATKMLIGICIAMFFIAVLDFMYQRFEFLKGMRMTKQELKDEYKQQEGDPKIKQRLRQIRMERAKNRMMSDVPKSDVVITNPTHYAVALRYEEGKHAAPVLMAKGQDYIALSIRRIAEENDVPIVENPPLARALYQSVDIGKEIPIEHYKTVAEIISYIYRLKGKLPAAPPPIMKP